MKKRILSIILILLLVIPQINVYAKQNQNEFKIISISDSTYTVELDIAGVYSVPYTGHMLNDYACMVNVYKNGERIYDVYERWENPNYVIVNGIQTQNILITCYNESINDNYLIINCVVEFNGVEEVKITPTPTISKDLTGGYSEDYTLEFNVGQPVSILTVPNFYSGNNMISGTFAIINWDSSESGTKIFNWVFIPDDSYYNTKTGTVKIYFRGRLSDDNGQPKAISLTATNITLTSDDASYNLDVSNAVKSSSYSFKSKDTDIVKVNSKSGVIKAVNDGSSSVICTETDSNGKKKLLAAKVIVSDDIKTTISKDAMTLDTEEASKLNVYNKVKGSTVKWTTSDKSIATVNSSGKVTGIKSGTAIITATVKKGTEVIVLTSTVKVK